MRPLILILALLNTSWASLDFKSYCAGWCKHRYQDGTEIQGRCACIDYYPINLKRQIEMPKRSREKGESNYYDGVDEMHYSPSE